MKVVALLLIAAVTILLPASVEAAQTYSNGQVVHSNPIPVILHRAVPPYRGVHVYQGRAGGRR